MNGYVCCNRKANTFYDNLEKNTIVNSRTLIFVLVITLNSKMMEA
jgi:hypothetical protein